MVKHAKGWELLAKLEHQKNAYVKNFLGGKWEAWKPCTKDDDPEHIIIHVGTNDLNSESSFEIIEKPIVDLENSLVSEKKRVIISGIME